MTLSVMEAMEHDPNQKRAIDSITGGDRTIPPEWEAMATRRHEQQLADLHERIVQLEAGLSEQARLLAEERRLRARTDQRLRFALEARA